MAPLARGEAVEEALCFGWVDSRPARLEERSLLKFTPRRPGSEWSRLNQQRVARPIATRLMAPAGLAKVNAAKADRSWNALDIIEDLRMPGDFTLALNANPAARRNFDAFSRSSRKIILGWVERAKRPETRTRRIRESVDLAARNIKANHYRQ